MSICACWPTLQALVLKQAAAQRTKTQAEMYAKLLYAELASLDAQFDLKGKAAALPPLPPIAEQNAAPPAAPDAAAASCASGESLDVPMVTVAPVVVAPVAVAPLSGFPAVKQDEPQQAGAVAADVPTPMAVDGAACQEALEPVPSPRHLRSTPAEVKV